MLNGDLLPEKIVPSSESPGKLVVDGDILPEKLVAGGGPILKLVVGGQLAGEARGDGELAGDARSSFNKPSASERVSRIIHSQN
ncbi:hypothetical protein PF011_g22402 [Phytophthora fragariae]|uniref:Uncharacterized protein n=1 Tax=Phytophthora fragariae TaxID=53985 RepID=A0A6A3IF15_9STRA|nr:hypothetical protein PF011_g22402 [Phytophthora fragariae]